jgi:hypothetical protein
MAVTFSSLRGDILRHAPEVPIVLVVDTLREAAREFFTKSKAWRETHSVDLVDGQSTYNFTDETINTSFPNTAGTPDADIVAWYDPVVDDSIYLTKLTSPQLRRSVPYSSSGLSNYSNPTNTSITIYGIPGAAQAGLELSATLALTVSRTATGVASDRMVDLYKDAIVQGALYRLMMMPRQPWSDPRMAGVYEALFRESILDADNRAQSEYSTRVARENNYGGL